MASSHPEVAQESVSLLNATPSPVEVQVIFVDVAGGPTLQRVGAVLPPGKFICFKPQSTIMKPTGQVLKVNIIYAHTFGSSLATSKHDRLEAGRMVVREVDGKLVIVPCTVEDEISEDKAAVLGAVFETVTVRNITAGAITVTLSGSTNISIMAGSEERLKLTSAVESIVVKGSTSTAPVVYLFLAEEAAADAVYELVGWPSVGLAVRPVPHLPSTTSAGSRAPLGNTGTARAPLGAADGKGGAKFPVAKRKGKSKGLDQRRPGTSSDMDAYLPTAVAPEALSSEAPSEVAEAVVTEVPTSAEPPATEDDTPDSWETEETEVQPVEPAAPEAGEAQGVAAETEVEAPSGASLRPGGKSRALRPGGAALRPAMSGHKNGAGSGTDYAGVSTGGPVEIKLKYTREQMYELLKPIESLTFPSHLRPLPLSFYSKTGGGRLGAPGAPGDLWGRNKTFGPGGKGAAPPGGPGRGMAPGVVGGGGQWVRTNAPPPLAQLTKAKNPFLTGARKQQKDRVAEIESTVLSILNKLTPQTYEKLKQQLFELPIDRAPLLKMLIQKIFDKVIDEASFAELYARLCGDLSDCAASLWQYVKIIRDSAGSQWYWAADVAARDMEVLGPYASAEACLQTAAQVASGHAEPSLVPCPPNATLIELVKDADRLVKLYTAGSAFFFAFDSFAAVEAMAELDLAGGPFEDSAKGTGAEEAFKKGQKATSLRRLLLNKCQEAFETDDIYVEIDRKFHEGDLSKLSPSERAERMEEREMATIKAKKRMLGNIRFVGELYKLPKMLQDRIIHTCVQQLLSVTNYNEEGAMLIEGGAPVLKEISPLTADDEENIEALCKLLATIGLKLETDISTDEYKRALMQQYLQRLHALSTNRELPSRMRFMAQDFFELRSNGYVPRRKEDRQMTQEQIRRLAAQDLSGEEGGKGKGKPAAPMAMMPQRRPDGRPGPQDVRGPPPRALAQPQPPRGESRHGDVRVMQRGAGAPQASYQAQPPPPPRAEDGLDAARSLLSDWCKERHEQSALDALREMGPSAASFIAEVALVKAVDASPVDRACIVDLVLLLLDRKVMEPSDLLAPLKRYFEFYDDNLCDIPSLHQNMAQFLGPLLVRGFVHVENLENMIKFYMANGDPPLQATTAANLFKALSEQRDVSTTPAIVSVVLASKERLA